MVGGKQGGNQLLTVKDRMKEIEEARRSLEGINDMRIALSKLFWTANVNQRGPQHVILMDAERELVKLIGVVEGNIARLNRIPAEG